MSLQKSTTVRDIPVADELDDARVRTEDLPLALPGRAPVPQRTAFAALDTVAPALAARLADHQWFRLTPPPDPASRRHSTPPGGRAFTTVHGGLTVRGQVYGPDDAPTAHLVHGWAGWWQQLSGFVGPLLEAGYRVVAHDAPSHGDSPPGHYGPRSSRVMEIADAFAAVVWQQGPADLVVAHSIGAMSVMWARERGSTGAGAYAFLAATAAVEPMVDAFRHSLDLGPRTTHLLARRVERRVGHPFTAFDVPGMSRRLVDAGTVPPLLSIHDRGDRMAPARGSVDIARAWPGAELVLTDGLGHRQLLRDETTIARVARFAAQHHPGAQATSTPVPSSANSRSASPIR
ncbi:alpha/beta fold hydrolase [Ornithinimicrobium cavernae]|uniref:alpha/beta fold hydrolase n=1 Tax=Ornithinimicrobium cavernae TaxID=2666047 RepID=UPI0012B181BC|nr:alpha/beta hydrolase [Ornithinimicrobium cavernae]